MESLLDFLEWCINKSQNTKWRQKTYKGSTMSIIRGLPLVLKLFFNKSWSKYFKYVIKYRHCKIVIVLVQLYNSPSAHRPPFLPNFRITPQLPFENSSPPSHGQFFFQKNHNGYRNRHNEEPLSHDLVGIYQIMGKRPHSTFSWVKNRNPSCIQFMK